MGARSTMRTAARRLAAAAAVVALAAGTGCGGEGGSPGEEAPPDTLAAAEGAATGAPEETAAAGADTLRGTIAVVGSLPAPMVTLRRSAGAPSVLLRGDATESLAGLDGIEVEVRGILGAPSALPGPTLEVESFRVRAVEGRPAVDGIVEGTPGGGLRLRVPGGEAIPLEDPPGGIADRIGARVWAVGPPGGPVEAYGVIAGEPPR